jgi:hypothetical protein
MVWSDTSDPAEWDRRISELIASGEASPDDEFMRIGWLPPPHFARATATSQ